ncbi:hypothetical protein [Streptomyces sp. NPDC014006]|uniref:hypothetical protein n=1 Tax=Streptomyces sp. NPDC014006 TaxID=3364870 RepID=UPI0037002922
MIVAICTLAAIAVGAGVWAYVTRDQTEPLKAMNTCNEGIFSSRMEPLERLLSPDSSYKPAWSRVAVGSSFKISCNNSTSSGAVNLVAEMRDGSRDDWFAKLHAPSKVSRFDAGTEAVVWGREAAIYVECRSHTEASSYTAGMAHPYLAVSSRASGSAGQEEKTRHQDLARLANGMLFEAEMETGCQGTFATPPSDQPRVHD